MTNDKHTQAVDFSNPNADKITSASTKPMTNNKQQTALEWFIEELEYKGDLRETPSIRNIQLNIDTSDYMELKVQAKAMHKEATLKLYYAYEDYVLREEGIIKTFGQFYNETYGGNNE
jgi:hypothetical protein